MSGLIDLFTAGAGGAVTGLLGSITTGIFGFFQEKQKHKNAVEMRELDIKESQIEAASADRKAALDIEKEEKIADKETFKASIEDARSSFLSGHDLTPPQTWCLVIVDMVRSLMRPVLTLGTLFVCLHLWVQVVEKIKNGEETDLHHSMIYLATTCVTWWFGTRPADKIIRNLTQRPK